MNEDLNELCLNLNKSIRELGNFLGRYFFVYPDKQELGDMEFALLPDLNIEMRGKGNPGDSRSYEQHAEQMMDIIREVKQSYSLYRKSIKNLLFY